MPGGFVCVNVVNVPLKSVPTVTFVKVFLRCEYKIFLIAYLVNRYVNYCMLVLPPKDQKRK